MQFDAIETGFLSSFSSSDKPFRQFLDFIYPAYDQIVSEAAKMRYRSGGEFPT